MWGARRLLLLPAGVASWHDPPVHRVPLGVLRACRWHLVLLALDLLVMMALVVGHVAHVVGVRLVWSGRRGAVVAVQLLLRVVQLLLVVLVVLVMLVRMHSMAISRIARLLEFLRHRNHFADLGHVACAENIRFCAHGASALIHQ